MEFPEISTRYAAKMLREKMSKRKMGKKNCCWKNVEDIAVGVGVSVTGWMGVRVCIGLGG
jgi:hypothetical protein